MLNELLGTKIGMIQIFDEEKRSVPVTVIDVSGWFVTQVKTQEHDGYDALQLGLPRKRYREKPFSAAWLKDKKTFFLNVKEVANPGDKNYSVGQKVSLSDFAISEKDVVKIAGISTGRGFQGVVKRWGFSGGPAAHGSTFHKAPGSVGNMCSQGNVIKGKKLPGHHGCKLVTIKGLKVARIDKKLNCLFVKGAVPGRKNTLLFIRKQA